MDYKALGNRIREERKRLGLTQAQLAEQAGISETYMGMLENGNRRGQIETLVRISNALGTSIDYLLSDSLLSSDKVIIDQFSSLIHGQSQERKQMAIDVVRTMFSHLGNERQNPD